MPATTLPPEPTHSPPLCGDATATQAHGSGGGLYHCGRWLLDYLPDGELLAKQKAQDDDTIRARIAELILEPNGVEEDTYGNPYSVTSGPIPAGEPENKSAPPGRGAGGGDASKADADLPGDLRPQAALGLLSGKLAAIAEVRKHVDCGRYASVHVHRGGQIATDVGCPAQVVLPHTCKGRWCPRCHGIWANKMASRIADTVSQFQWPLSVNLTLQNYPRGQLRIMLDDLRDSFRRLRRRRYWKDNIDGCIAVRGLTYNYEAQTWHAHLHLILDCQWLDPKTWQAEWASASRGKGRRIGQIKRVHNGPGEARHVVHGTKGDVEQVRKAIRLDPDVFDEAVFECKGMQRVFCCCSTRLRPEPKPEAYCPYCGARFKWSDWDRYLLSASELYRWIRRDTFHWFLGWARAPDVDMPPVRSVWNLQELQN